MPAEGITEKGAGHARWVRFTHGIIAASVLTLIFSGVTILMAHPRLYWGQVGNDLTPTALELPIGRNYRHGGWAGVTAFFQAPDSPVTARRTYDIFNENGWARSLHFLAAWLLVVTATIYAARGIVSGHLWRDLVPRGAELAPRRLWQDILEHARLQIRPAKGGPPYGVLQKWAYSAVVLLALPLMILTGMTMSPAITAAYPALLDAFGGSQSARTLHFSLFVALTLFILVHVIMVMLSGFTRQLRAMTLGS